MALNLSTLTSPATSGDVLAEALTTADFLEPVPVLRNLARGSQKGGDAKQDVALNQPKALPLIKNPQGNLGGYLYIPNVTGNYAEGPSVTIGSNETWEGELDMVVTQWGSHLTPMGGGYWNLGFGLVFYNNGNVRLFSKGSGSSAVASGVTLGSTFNVKYGFDGTNIYVDIDDTRVYTGTAPSQTSSITHNLELNQQAQIGNVGNYAIQKAKLTVNSSVVFDCDFNGSTSIRHGDTKFKASVGGPVTINQSGNDPATVIKKSVLRFANKSDDSTNICLEGLFNQTITNGYMFAAFTVLGDGGEGNGRVFSVDNGNDASVTGAIFSLGATNNLRSYYRGVLRLDHIGLFDDALGNVLHDVKLTTGSQVSKVNNADQKTDTGTGSLTCVNFNIASRHDDDKNGALDLEFLALFPSSITDAQADSVRNYINNRNNVFSLVDNSYYFFDPQKADFTGNFTDANTLDGYITGSDLGDTDVRSNLTLVQATLNDQPSTDGYTITFNDAAEHLEFENGASQNLSGWQVCGTSLGTFAYRVQGAVTELNLLGNAGVVRSIGDLYGILLLPESASAADIEAARRLLIDRGAADGVTPVNLFTYWFLRSDIVEFKQIDTSSVTSFKYAWKSCSNLESFPLIDTSNAISFEQAFYGNSSLSSFPAIQAPLCTNFTSAWQNCSALTSFPADAKLGTSAQNVNFSDAWRDSGLQSFPALDLSKGTNLKRGWFYTPLASFGAIDASSSTNFSSAWQNCSALQQFPADAKLGTEVTNVNFTSAWKATGLESFSTPLPTATDCTSAWRSSDLVSFSNIDINLCRDFEDAWRFCDDLVDFPPLFTNWNPQVINSAVFHDAWDACPALSAESVGNILQSIDASGQYATADGESGSNAISVKEITIDYDGTTLSAATNTAVDSLKAKGWSIVVNGVTL